MGTQADRVAAIRHEMGLFERRVGLDAACPDATTGAMRYLNMGEAELAALSADQLGVAALAVGNLAFHLQNEFAIHVAMAKRLAGAVKRLVVKSASEQRAYSLDERILLAIQESPFAVDLDRQAQDEQHRADRLAYLAKQAEFAASLMMDLYKARRWSASRPTTFEQPQ